MIFLSAAVCFIFILPYNAAGHNLRYSDLEEMEADCYPGDTCSLGGRRSFQTSNCACDSQCQLYRDCCIDAETTLPATSFTNVSCFPDGTRFPNRGVYVIDKCQNGWRGPAYVRQRCEILTDMSDPLVSGPATNTEDKVTYKNRYCAECNGADQSQLQYWIIRLKCKSLESMNSTGNITSDYIGSRLTFKTTYPYRNKWGIYYWNDSVQREIFYPCKLSFELPDYLASSVRFCRYNLTSTCAFNWTENSVRSNCGAYMAVVYYDSAIYMNPHCAECNNEDLTQRKCTSTVITRGKQAMSFTLMMDVNLSDGNRVGESNPCPDNQMYDSFHKNCRNLVCILPGYRRQGDQCVPE